MSGAEGRLQGKTKVSRKTVSQAPFRDRVHRIRGAEQTLAAGHALSSAPRQDLNVEQKKKVLIV